MFDSFPFFVAKRYLISRKSRNIINIISVVSTGGMLVGTAALIVILSVFNGFEDLVTNLFNSFNPDIKIRANYGKTFVLSAEDSVFMFKEKAVAHWDEVLEETVLFKYGDHQHIGVIKGYSDGFQEYGSLDTMMYTGQFLLKSGTQEYASAGMGLAYYLSINPSDFTKKLEVFVPRKSKTSLLQNAFRRKSLPVSGIYSIQQEIDNKYALAPLSFVRRLLNFDKEISALEIYCENSEELPALKERLKSHFSENDYSIEDRYEQEALLYGIMKSEKWVIFMILSFIILIASFNIVGSLTVLIIEKQKDIWILKRFGLVKLQGGNSFIIDAYPVVVNGLDFLYTGIVVFGIGLIATWVSVGRIKSLFSN